MMFPFKSRSITRAQWKVIWRQLRIVNREAAKAQFDCMVFGTGYLQIGDDVPDFIRRVDPYTVRIERETEPA